MIRPNLSDLLHRLTRGVEAPAHECDRQLVQRALAERDQAALQAIVCRHGRMVYGVCWRVLQHPQDTEDAFQATFLVLAGNLRRLRKPASLASWLHGIARRVALRARVERAARRRCEQLAPPPSTALPEDVTWAELRAALDDELRRLPDKWRHPLILCYLEGRTQDESAQQLGWSKSTLRRRLDEGRTALAARLQRRGLVVPAALSAVLLSDCLAAGEPFPGLVAATTKAAAGVAAGESLANAASAKAAALAEGVLRAMIPSKLRLTALVVLVAGMAASGTAAFFQVPSSKEPRVPAAQGVAQAVPKPSQPNDGRADDARRLQGEWQPVDGEKGGKPLAEDPGGERITFKGDEFSLGSAKAKFTLDTRKSPHELRVTLLDNKGKPQTVRMIYSLENDELKLCMPLGPDVAPPTEFKTKPGGNLLLLVLRRPSKDGLGAQKTDDQATVKRKWRRSDAAPDGNYKLWYVESMTEETCCLIKLQTKEGNQSATLLDTDRRDWEVTVVRQEAPAFSPPAAGQAPGVPIRLVLTTPTGDWIFAGRFSPPSLEARGHLEQGGSIFPAALVATELPKLKFTVRDLPATSLFQAVRLERKVWALRQRADFAKDAAEKAALLKQVAQAEKEAVANAPKLLRQGFEKAADDPLIFDAARQAARFATKYQVPADQLRAMFAKADQAAATYGRTWERRFKVQIAAALAPQKDYASLALDIATQLEKELGPEESAATQQPVLKALAAAMATAGSPASIQERLARRLAEVEEALDREYRAKVPPFKPSSFVGRKSASDRAVVVELFTGTQCPPCVGASVAFEALRATYRPTEVILLEYHEHIPGPDPLANADSEARLAYYAQKFPAEAVGVPTTFFNGKPATGGGGPMTRAQEKYNQYREVIDPLLETPAAAKLSGSVTKQGNTVQIEVEVTDLKSPGRDVRLRLLLVEETVRYVGGNRLRLHHHVVRSLVGGTDGFALNEKAGKHRATVDLESLRRSLAHYLEDYNVSRQAFSSSDRPLDLGDLRLIALVQDDRTREILQAAQFEIASPHSRR